MNWVMMQAFRLKNKALKLKEDFNEAFWIEEENFYSMALDCHNSPVHNVTSNIGHCLAMGIIDKSRQHLVEEKLMSSEINSGWGLRTLNTTSPAFDPISYHNGSVWVHDTVFASLGMTESSRSEVIKNLFEAANLFEDNRLPELFAGFQRKEGDLKIQNYPEACAPQAWASGALIWGIFNLLEHRRGHKNIEFNKEKFPSWLDSISVKYPEVATI